MKGRTTGYWTTVDHITDRDTFWAGGVKYRVIDIDTPETPKNRRRGHKCEPERRLAARWEGRNSLDLTSKFRE